MPNLEEIEAAIHLSQYGEEYKGVVKFIGDLHKGGGSDAPPVHPVPLTIRPSTAGNPE